MNLIGAIARPVYFIGNTIFHDKLQDATGLFLIYGTRIRMVTRVCGGDQAAKQEKAHG